MASAPPHSPFAQAARSLLRTLRRRGTLRPGSLIVTLFGDAIAPRGGTVALASLIRAGALFGVTERHVRTSVGRLAQDGWIEARREGRVSFYSLSATGRRRFAEATQRIYFSGDDRDAAGGWDGQWTLVALLPGMRADRERIRREMTLLGFGQLQPGLLASPTRDAPATLAALRDLGVIDEVFVTRATGAGGVADETIARSAWNLDDLERRYRDFIQLFAAVGAAAANENERGGRSSDPAPDCAFLVRTLLIHEYRRVHLRDPLLPARMLPQDWSGRQADEMCRRLYAILFGAAERYLSTFMRSVAGKLPAPRAEVYRRFGGLPQQQRAQEPAARTGGSVSRSGARRSAAGGR